MKRPKRFAARRDAPDGFLDWVRTLWCVVPVEHEFRPVIEIAHVRSRGAGGNDFGNVVDLCSHHHREQHQIGIRSFEAKYNIDMAQEAQRLATEWNNREDTHY